jgi:hypothetical protein
MQNNDSLNEQLRQLLEEICKQPSGGCQRQKLLNQLIYKMQQSRRIWRGGDVTGDRYEDALQQTWLWFCKNLHQYDPTQASVITWFNTTLKYRLADTRREVAREKATRIANDDAEFDLADRLPANTETPPILAEIRAWVEREEKTLRRLHLRDCPEINARVLILRRLPPATTWQALALEFGVAATTLSHFYQRTCFPRLLEFGKTQGYL